MYKPLSDCVNSLSGGTPSKNNDSFWSGNLPWVSSGEMGQQRITDTELHITQEAGERYSKIVTAGTVLVVVRGMSLAREFRVSLTQREMAFNQDLKALIPRKNVDPAFLFYSLYGRRFEICKLASESAHGTKKIDTKVLNAIPVFLPESLVQSKIVAILSAYDDLIENNQRRIAILEKMAEEIYCEWFVRMRFPGHEQVAFHKGIPEGWETTDLESISNILMGQSPKSEFYNSIGEGLPFHQGVGTYGNRFPRNEVFCSVGGRIANEGDVLFSVRAPVGRLNIASEKIIIGRGLSAIRHKKGYQSYLYYLLKSNFSDEDIIGNGSIFNSVGKDELNSFKVFLPNENVIKRFESIIAVIDQQIKVLIQANQNLQQTRDRLLPRLISGKLSVEDLDIQFPPSMSETEAATHER